jgi:hypothetical protein
MDVMDVDMDRCDGCDGCGSGWMDVIDADGCNPHPSTSIASIHRAIHPYVYVPAHGHMTLSMCDLRGHACIWMRMDVHVGGRAVLHMYMHARPCPVCMYVCVGVCMDVLIHVYACMHMLD